MKSAERVKEDEKTVCVWVNRSEERADGGFEHTGTPYLESLIDSCGRRTDRTLKVLERKPDEG